MNARLHINPLPRVREIVVFAARLYGVHVDAVYGRGRHQAASIARQHAWSLLRADPLTKHYSLGEIGSMFGGRDHSTVLSGIRTHRKRNPAPEVA